MYIVMHTNGAALDTLDYFEQEPPLTDSRSRFSEENIEKKRVKTSLRQRYEAEARVLERRLGGLDGIKESLGLSQRKIAQLLLVDPSAMTRWSQGGSIPPHIWRSLAWYLALQDKYPALDAAFWLQGVARTADSDLIAKNSDELKAQKLEAEKLRETLEKKIDSLHEEIRFLKSPNTFQRARENTHDGELPGVSMPDFKGSYEEKPNADATQEVRAQRALANFFLALTFGVLGYAIAKIGF